MARRLHIDPCSPIEYNAMNEFLRLLDDDEAQDADLTADASGMLLTDEMIMDWLLELDLEEVDVEGVWLGEKDTDKS